MACGDSDLNDDLDWYSGLHSPELPAKQPWPLFPREEELNKAWGVGLKQQAH